MKKAILVPLLFVIILLALGTLQIWWVPAKTLITIIKIGLSWPVLIIVFLTSVIYLFEEPLRGFVNDLADIQVPGWRFSRNQEQKDNPESNTISISSANSLISFRDSQWQNTIEAERQVAVAAIEKNEALQNYINQLQSENLKWRFFYANVHLVLKTKYVLAWFSDMKTVNRKSFEIVWKQTIPEEKEQEAVLNALVSLEFIEEKNTDYSITRLGEVYTDYLKNTNQIKLNV